MRRQTVWRGSLTLSQHDLLDIEHNFGDEELAEGMGFEPTIGLDIL